MNNYDAKIIKDLYIKIENTSAIIDKLNKSNMISLMCDNRHPFTSAFYLSDEAVILVRTYYQGELQRLKEQLKIISIKKYN